MSSTMSYETTLKAKASTPSDSFAASEVEYATSEKSALMSNSLMVKELQPDFVAFSLNWGIDFCTPPVVKLPSSL